MSSIVENEKITEHDLMTLDMAARGCVSGALKEWPAVFDVLLRHGRSLLPTTSAIEIRSVCRELLAQKGYGEEYCDDVVYEFEEAYYNRHYC